MRLRYRDGTPFLVSYVQLGQHVAERMPLNIKVKKGRVIYTLEIGVTVNDDTPNDGS